MSPFFFLMFGRIHSDMDSIIDWIDSNPKRISCFSV